MDQTNNSELSPAQKNTSNPTDPTTVVPANRRDTPLDGGHSTKIGGMWNIKHEISSPKFYELLIKSELKGDTALDLNNFYKHINMSLNTVTRLREDLLPGYQYTKINPEFAEYFIPDCDQPSYSWNIQIYISLGHSLLVAMTNDTCVKSSMATKSYKAVRTNDHEISGYNIFSRLLHSRGTHLGGTDGDVRSIYPFWRSRTENKLKNFIAEFSDSNKKLCSLDKLSSLPDFSSGT